MSLMGRDQRTAFLCPSYITNGVLQVIPMMCWGSWSYFHMHVNGLWLSEGGVVWMDGAGLGLNVSAELLSQSSPAVPMLDSFQLCEV